MLWKTVTEMQQIMKRKQDFLWWARSPLYCTITQKLPWVNILVGYEKRSTTATYLKHSVTVVLYGALAGDVQPRQLCLWAESRQIKKESKAYQRIWRSKGKKTLDVLIILLFYCTFSNWEACPTVSEWKLQVQSELNINKIGVKKMDHCRVTPTIVPGRNAKALLQQHLNSEQKNTHFLRCKFWNSTSEFSAFQSWL